MSSLLTVEETAYGRRSKSIVAFIDEQQIARNAATNLLCIVLLIGCDEMVGTQQAFDLVQFNHGEIISIERFYPLNKIEFLRCILNEFVKDFAYQPKHFSNVQSVLGNVFGATD